MEGVRTRLVQILETLVGPYGKALEGLGIGQALDEDFVGNVVGNALNELVHGGKK